MFSFCSCPAVLIVVGEYQFIIIQKNGIYEGGGYLALMVRMPFLIRINTTPAAAAPPRTTLIATIQTVLLPPSSFSPPVGSVGASVCSVDAVDSVDSVASVDSVDSVFSVDSPRAGVIS